MLSHRKVKSSRKERKIFMCKLTARYHEDPAALHVGTEPNRAYYLPQARTGRPESTA